MISFRCKEKIEQELKELGFGVSVIDQGVIEFGEDLTEGQIILLEQVVSGLGYEILDLTNSKFLNSISELINELIYNNPEMPRQDYPSYLTKKIGFNHSDMVRVFLQVYGINLPQYITLQLIERMKEMILYEGRNVTEIAKTLHYKNTAQLTRTFKNSTGLTPAYFRKLNKERLEIRKKTNLDETKI